MAVGTLGMLGLTTAAGIGSNAVNNAMNAGASNRFNKKNQAFYKEMTDYNQEQAMEMWRNTGPVGMMKELKTAGLNPGLIYGMGGAGGQTTNNNAGEGPQGAQIQNADVSKGMGMMLQTALQKAQVDNLNADTNQKNVLANKAATVDTEEAKGRIALLSEGVESENAKQVLMDIEKDIKNVEQYVATETQNAQVASIKTMLRRSTAEMHMLERDNEISAETKDEKIKLIEQEVVNKMVDADLKRAMIGKTAAEIENMKQQIILEAGRLANEKDKTVIAKKLQEFETSYGKQIGQTLGNVVTVVAGAAARTPTTIQNTTTKEYNTYR